MRLKMYKQFPHVIIILSDMNTKLGKKIWTGIAIGTCDLHDERNNVLILVMYNCENLNVTFIYTSAPKNNENDFFATRRRASKGKWGSKPVESVMS
jgi:hypothetical protein